MFHINREGRTAAFPNIPPLIQMRNIVSYGLVGDRTMVFCLPIEIRKAIPPSQDTYKIDLIQAHFSCRNTTLSASCKFLRSQTCWRVWFVYVNATTKSTELSEGTICCRFVYRLYKNRGCNNQSFIFSLFDCDLSLEIDVTFDYSAIASVTTSPIGLGSVSEGIIWLLYQAVRLARDDDLKSRTVGLIVKIILKSFGYAKTRRQMQDR